MNAKHSRLLLLPVVTLLSLPAFSQELTVFQDDGLRAGPTQGGPPFGAQAAAPPEVVLKGIYRLGDTYHVSLQSGEGGAVHNVMWQPGSQSSAPVFNGYQIQIVDSRNVTFGLPPGMSCQTTVQSGGTCLGRNQMSLTFTQTASTPASRPPNQGNNNSNSDRPFGQRNDNETDREAIEAPIRGRAGGRGNNNGNTGGRGGRGSFNGGNNGGDFPGNDNTGGRGGAPQ